MRQADELIEFCHPAGWNGVARGVVELGVRSSSQRNGDAQTVETYSAHSVELTLPVNSTPAYVIEWVANLPSGFIWTEPVSFSTVETTTKSVGTGESELRMTGSVESGGGSKALHLIVSGIHVYVMLSVDDDAAKGAGQILYKAWPEQAFRDQVRGCLSFILGKPIVYLGHTDYSEDWSPISMKSVNAFTVDRGAFKLHDLPPYPIHHDRYANVIDPNRVSNMVNALLDKFETIKLNELLWSYWYAVCAPTHAAPAHFGSVIEQLLNNLNRGIKTKRGALLDGEIFKSFGDVIKQWLKSVNIDPEIRPILEGKLASLNQAPPGLVLRRLLDGMGMKTSDIEIKAWKHRNMAAHGSFPNDPISVILNRKLLQIFFHRMLAGITQCSSYYIDYYSLGHPERAVTEAVPARE